jgi:integrase
MKHRTGYLFKRGDNFYVAWEIEGKRFKRALRDSNGQPITSKREAEAARDAFMAPLAVADEAESLTAIASKLEGRKAELAAWDEQQNPPLPLAHAWAKYMQSNKRPDTGPDTLAVYEGQFGQFVAWMKEHHPEVTEMRDVGDTIAEEYASYLNGGGVKLAPGTYNKHLNVLALVFRVLSKAAKLTVNPWADMERKPLKGKVNHRRELTVDQLRKLCQSATGEMRILFAIGIYSGLRLRDCATLRWDEVDLRRNFISRVPNKTVRYSEKPVFVPLHPDLRGMLGEIPEASRGEYVLPETAAMYLNHKKNLVVAIQKHFIDSGIVTHKAGTGVDGKRAVVQFGFHSLRHSFVSICAEANVPLSVVQSIIGHSSPAMTQVYTHTSPLAARQAVAALPSMTDDKAQPVKVSPESILSECRALAKGLTPANLAEKKAALLALLNSAAEDGQFAREARN